jgi:hypothetical protein
MQLLTELGMGTGFPNSAAGIHSNCHGGMEKDLEEADAPYVVKSPALCEHLDRILQTSDIVIDHAIIPIRNLHDSAESRRDVSRRNQNRRGTPGGVWLTRNPCHQEAVLAQQLFNLVHALAKHQVPMIWLYFPRLVKDAHYLYQQLKPVLPGTDFESFQRAFEAVSRPELVHSFEPQRKGQNSLLARMLDLLTR